LSFAEVIVNLMLS